MKPLQSFGLAVEEINHETINLYRVNPAPHQGQCDADIAELRLVPAIRRQLDKLSPPLVAECLREYGAWDAEELADHDANLSRLLWIACGDIVEGVN